MAIRPKKTTSVRQSDGRENCAGFQGTQEKVQRGYKDQTRTTQADSGSGISSLKTNISKAVLSRKPNKPQAGTIRSRKTSATPNNSAASSIAASSAASSIASSTTSKGKRNRKAPAYFGFESLVCSVSDPKIMPAPKR